MRDYFRIHRPKLQSVYRHKVFYVHFYIFVNVRHVLIAVCRRRGTKKKKKKKKEGEEEEEECRPTVRIEISLDIIISCER